MTETMSRASHSELHYYYYETMKTS